MKEYFEKGKVKIALEDAMKQLEIENKARLSVTLGGPLPGKVIDEIVGVNPILNEKTLEKILVQIMKRYGWKFVHIKKEKINPTEK